MPPLVSAIVLNTNAARQTAQCVQKLQEQTLIDDMEIIVVENHSGDDSANYLRNQQTRGWPFRLVETAHNDGFGHGYNTGIRYASGDYILINNPSKILPPNGIEQLVKRLQQDETIGLIAPALQHPDGSFRASARRYPKPLDLVAKRTMLKSIFGRQLKRYLDIKTPDNQLREVEWVAGGCIMMRRQLFEDLGGFDERFFLFFEDTDLCRRVRKAGWRVVYDPTVIGADKKQRFSDGGLFKLISTRIGRSHIVSAVRYFHKWGLSTK